MDGAFSLPRAAPYSYLFLLINICITTHYCNTLQCNCNALQLATPHSYSLLLPVLLLIPATHCNTLQAAIPNSYLFPHIPLCITTRYYHTLQHTATHCNTLQHASPTLTATPLTQAASHTHYCNTRHTLQHTATHLSHTSSHPSHTSSITF